jgi:hypothetical protein
MLGVNVCNDFENISAYKIGEKFFQFWHKSTIIYVE